MNLRSNAIAVLSLVGTPVLLILSPAITVYLSSQQELNHQLSLLMPFALAAGLVFALGIGLLLMPQSGAAAERGSGPSRMWLYYLAGPFFLVFTLLREAPLYFLDEFGGVLLAIAIYVAASVALARRIRHEKVVSFFAILSVAFAASEGLRLYTGAESAAPVEAVDDSELSLLAANETLPNIYHIVLDGFQSDIFGLVATDSDRMKMDGVTWYEEASATYEHTIWSLPSVFLGAEYDFSMSQRDFQAAGFNASASLLNELKDAGYSTIAFSRKLYEFDYTMFDEMVQHANNIDVTPPQNDDAFMALWVYRTLPAVIGRALARRGWLISANDLQNLGARTFLASSAPIESSLGFQKYLEQEALLPARGRYTFIHLIMPHDPFVLGAGCEETSKSNVLVQAQCAVRLIGEFIDRLKSLGRYDDSLILIHGDHGERYKVDGTNLTPIKYRSNRSLLLLKLPTAESTEGLVTSSIEASLIDIAPTIYEVIGRESALHEGFSLSKPDAQAFASRERSYNVVIDETHFRQHKVEGRDLIFVEEIPLPDASPDISELLAVAPLVPLNEVFEAEAGALSRSADVAADLPGVKGSYVSNGNKSFRFELDRDATVRLRARIIAPNGNNNSSFIRLNGGDSDIWDMPISRQWDWKTFNKTWSLPEGEHLLSIEYREQVYLDQIVLLVD
ncbi:MAG: sulfatase-like hydrolase/transferase [Woeseiaceae bacterium]|nr:sulfatase-like hydrolase/transferase [Woeseiaceae bacterium]